MFHRVYFVRAVRCIFLGLVGSFGSPVSADTFTPASASFLFNAQSSSSTLHLQAFDSTLGTLQSVQLSFDATRRYDWALWNLSGQDDSLPYQASLTGTALSFNGVVFGFTDLTFGPQSTPVLPAVTLAEYLSESAAGRAEFLAGSSPSYASAFDPGTAVTGLSHSFLLPGVTGDLNVSLNPGIFDVSSNGNFLSNQLFDLTGTVSVTYTYAAASVPDSQLGFLLPAVLLGLIVVAQSRRTESISA
jgi:hypothetical protein